MKNYRSAIAALVLTFVFSTSAFATEGIIWTERTPPPPPPTNGIIWTETTPPAPEEGDLTEIAFSLLQALMPLL